MKPTYLNSAQNTKKCSLCEFEKPTTEFYRKTASSDGLMLSCKECHKQTNKKWDANNKERRRVIVKKSKAKNPEKVKQWAKNWQAANKEYVAARQKQWRKENPEKHRAHNAKWAKANPEKVEILARRSNEKNRESDLRRLKEWKKANPERVREDSRKRRVGRDKEAYAYSLILRNDPCAYCGSKEDLAIDHIHPVSKGGSNHWENLTSACRSCNSVKRAKTALAVFILFAKRRALKELKFTPEA